MRYLISTLVLLISINTRSQQDYNPELALPESTITSELKADQQRPEGSPDTTLRGPRARRAAALEQRRANEANQPNTPKEIDPRTGTVIPYFTVGSSMPFGKYSTISTSGGTNTTYGFADPGMSYNFGMMILLDRTFGVTVSLSYFDNPVNINRYADYFTARVKSMGVDNYSYAIKTGSWRSNNFMLGLAYKLPQERVSFDLNFKFGVISARTPDIEVESIDELGQRSEYFTHESEQHFQVAAAIGTQFQFKIINDLFLNLGSELLFSQVNMNKQLYPDTYSGYYFAPYYDKINLMTFNLSLGLAYQFKP